MDELMVNIKNVFYTASISTNFKSTEMMTFPFYYRLNYSVLLLQIKIY